MFLCKKIVLENVKTTPGVWALNIAEGLLTVEVALYVQYMRYEMISRSHAIVNRDLRIECFQEKHVT